MSWKEKLMSRKFWCCAAAFLASLGTGIAGLAQGNETIAMAGGICTVVSASIYAACEAAVDVARQNSNTQSINLTSGDKTVVKEVLTQQAPVQEPKE